MIKNRKSKIKNHPFRNKLILNQWLISLFGIDPLVEHREGASVMRPFHKLAAPIRNPHLEGLDADNLHHFYHHLGDSPLFSYAGGDPNATACKMTRGLLLQYEENIVRHTLAINEKRHRPIVWKYYQWLTLLFVEIYLDRFFSNPEILLHDLNVFVERFNARWVEFADIPPYTADDLNKLCLQNATGSGKTLLMHVNLLQYRHYAKLNGKENDLSRVILLTPNERLSEQHIDEFHASGFLFVIRLEPQKPISFEQIDVIEITKLGDQEGPNTIATRSLGDQNLLLVDEGHRGMSGKEEGVWFTRRSQLCAKGFTFEYSATFEQAVQSSGNADFENSYAKTIIFDYSYRWFYEDGFGKDYQILNIPKTYTDVQTKYLTACLLKFYQQLRIYEEKKKDFSLFNLEKPLWVFVGSTVTKAKGGSLDEKVVAADVAQIVEFIAAFLAKDQEAISNIQAIITGTGQDTGLLDKDNNDIFAGAFNYLAKVINAGASIDDIYRDILARLFNNAAGGNLCLSRIKGESGEVALHVGTSETPFGLINVGDAKGLCDHVAEVAAAKGTHLTVEDSDFTEAMFASVKDSSSPVNLLIGSKKFVEGWDCWRVSTMGLMHVGRSEGTQIIQLFGRGVRLKGYEWSLMRTQSKHYQGPPPPENIHELETLNVFGIEADFMEKFREFLREEGLPGNERRKIIQIPLNVTYDFGKKLKILRPKRKASDGKEYDFKKDAPVPLMGELPDYLTKNTIKKDWYPRIQAVQSSGGIGLATQKDEVKLREEHLALLDYNALYFELERYKRERSWHNFNISKDGIYRLLRNNTWYTLNLPAARLKPDNYDGVMLLQQVAASLLKGYFEHYYNYSKREFIEPRLELRELTPEDDNLPQDEFYQMIVDGDEEQVIAAIEQIKKELQEKKDDLLGEGDLKACIFGRHLFQPLFHVRKGGRITVLPVSLGESEYQFVTDLQKWCNQNKTGLEKDGLELFLLRNLSRGKGVGFFEAGNFYPDFILWVLSGTKQYVTFIDPHGLTHEGPASEKILFYQRIKDIEKRMNDASVVLNSFILSWTPQPQLKWGKTSEQFEEQNVLFMTDDQDHYIDKLFKRLSIVAIVNR
ncbi:MAG: type III restriction protein res subunit [Syntrophaceae bacterium]|nr:MAG: type III restriction protein res subunit [Syntrophaceae bacterium]